MCIYRYNPQESIENKYTGYAVRGKPNCPLTAKIIFCFFYTPLKINIEHNRGGLDIFLSKWGTVLFVGSILIFQGISQEFS